MCIRDRNEGDEVVVPAPYWVSYPEIVQLCGGRAMTVACGAESGFKLTPDALQASITSRTRWLILNSPSNPTGAVYSRSELQALAEVLLAVRSRYIGRTLAEINLAEQYRVNDFAIEPITVITGGAHYPDDAAIEAAFADGPTT